MDNFDLKKYLAEGRLIESSNLRDYTPQPGESFKVIKDYYVGVNNSNYNRNIKDQTLQFIKQVKIAPKELQNKRAYYVYGFGREEGGKDHVEREETSKRLVLENGPYWILREEGKNRSPLIELSINEVDGYLKKA